MKTLTLTLALALGILQSLAAELTWHTDLTKAQALAKAEKKIIMIDFTGSDWCGYCIKLDKEVFKTPEFAEYAVKNLVLVTIDFPRKNPLPEAQAKANNALKAKYDVSGFPTLVLLNPDGKEVGRQVGYESGSGTKAVCKLADGAKGK
jgi:thioredoxin-related protein